LSVEERELMDVKPTTIRLSIGLEDPADVFEDLSRAIATAVEKEAKQ
ncbi:MAG: PLP-dependent transferase, partial [Muribaculaceae bacterium]|nr:PLP-dependent transferase [Muribaculaceae bacterium]